MNSLILFDTLASALGVVFSNIDDLPIQLAGI